MIELTKFAVEQQVEMAKLYLKRARKDVDAFYQPEIDTAGENVAEALRNVVTKDVITVDEYFVRINRDFTLSKEKQDKWKEEYKNAVNPIREKRLANKKEMNNKYNSWKMKMLTAAAEGKVLGVIPTEFTLKLK